MVPGGRHALCNHSVEDSTLPVARKSVCRCSMISNTSEKEGPWLGFELPRGGEVVAEVTLPEQ